MNLKALFGRNSPWDDLFPYGITPTREDDSHVLYKPRLADTLIGIGTFGGLNFTRICVDEIFRTAMHPVEVLIVVGDPYDNETTAYAFEQRKKRGVHFIVHTENKGFAGTINDIYDFAWINGFENVIFCGNDVAVYPGCIDGMIDLARESDWDMICASMFDAQSLCARYPEARKYFEGENYIVKDFSARPWELHSEFRKASVEPDCLKDVRNFTLFKRSSFEKIGYADVSFFPNGYFEDNDFARRANLAGVKACGAPHCGFFHWWSRTIHQSHPNRPNGKFFDRNQTFYSEKWGGPVGKERWTLPFNGYPQRYGEVALPVTLKIDSRRDEQVILDYWRKKRV